VTSFFFSFSLTSTSASARERIDFASHCVPRNLVLPHHGSLSSNLPNVLDLFRAWLHPIARGIPRPTPINGCGHRNVGLLDKLEDGLCLCQVPVRHCDDGNACPAVCLASAKVAERNVVVLLVIACHAFGCDPQVAVHLRNIRVTR
jgi:hypothetical protein